MTLFEFGFSFCYPFHTYTPAIPARMHSHLMSATTFFALNLKTNTKNLLKMRKRVDSNIFYGLWWCKYTYKNRENFNWLTISLPMSTLSSTQNTGNIISGIVCMIGTTSIGLTSILNCIRFAARNGVPVI